MLTKRIIPCLDVTKGRVVKGTNFVNLRDAGDPVELACEYNREGADEVVFLDITASSDNRDTLLDMVEKSAKKLFIPFTVGGGVASVKHMRNILNAGADKVAVNSAAIKNPDLIHEGSSHFGNQCIVLAIDAKKVNPTNKRISSNTVLRECQLDEGSKWEVYSHGGRTPTGLDAVKWAIYCTQLGAGEILVTSMDQDGTKQGYDIPLTKTISDSVSIPVIASGGAGNIEHIEAALNCCDAALLASLLHFKELTIGEIKDRCIASGIPIRKT